MPFSFSEGVERRMIEGKLALVVCHTSDRKWHKTNVDVQEECSEIAAMQEKLLPMDICAAPLGPCASVQRGLNKRNF